MSDKTLEALLRERLTDSRAMTAALNINSDRVFIDFGQIGDLSRIRLQVKGNEFKIIAPLTQLEYEPVAVAAEDTSPINLVVDGDKILTEDGSRAVFLPEGFMIVSEAELSSIMDKAEASNPPSPINPDNYSKEDLVVMAKEAGAKFGTNDSKAVIAKAIDKARGIE